jgi:hypothetical protein
MLPVHLRFAKDGETCIELVHYYDWLPLPLEESLAFVSCPRRHPTLRNQWEDAKWSGSSYDTESEER